MTLNIKMRAANIPCWVKVFKYQKHKGTFSRFATDPEQYEGWTDLRYQICDRQGYDASWIRDKLEALDMIDDFERDLMQELDDYYEGLWEDHQDMLREERHLERLREKGEI